MGWLVSQQGTRLADQPDYSGMAVNERLFEAGLLGEFDRATIARDRKRMIALLILVDVGPETAEAILANPTMYGF